MADTTAPVPCGSRHTSVTVRVGRLPDLSDGHLLAVDSRTVQQRLTRACPSDGLGALGGDQTTRRLSRFQQSWFTPTVQQADDGATWFRCDVVAVGAADTLLPLPPRVTGLLARPGALDRWGTCGTASPDARGFARVVCSRAHTWRAVATVDLPADARYLAAGPSALGDSRCKAVAAARANGALSYTWTFEWPTRAAWGAGQRYGYCWVPDQG